MMSNMAKGLLIGLITLVIVVVGLVFISKQKSKAARNSGEAEAVKAEHGEEPVKAMEASAAPEAPWDGQVRLYNVDDKTAAFIMAIVSDTTGIPLDHLMFKSIKALA